MCDPRSLSDSDACQRLALRAYAVSCMRLGCLARCIDGVQRLDTGAAVGLGAVQLAWQNSLTYELFYQVGQRNAVELCSLKLPSEHSSWLRSLFD